MAKETSFSSGVLYERKQEWGINMIYLLSLISAAFVCAIAFIWKMSAIAKENRVKRADFPLRRLGEKSR
ncbi:hypothetical protein QKW52_20755 [Bacillus sonorensis]|nr:hypothetical protein [Bacillus sonorensis]